MNNLFRTGVLIAALTALFMGAGWLIGGASGMLIALAIGAATNLFAYWNADRLVLAAYGARPIARAEAPRLFDTVAELARRAGIPTPRLYLIESAQPNAFATGRDPRHAAVAVTRGLLGALDAAEVAAVIGHELSHVVHRDTLTMTVAATIAGAIGMLANFAFFLGPRDDERDAPLGMLGALLVAILAPVAALLVQMAISRTREYEADRRGAEISGDPQSLASALGKIEALARRTMVPDAERNPATAHLFIINPLHSASLAGLFATHPATDERVRRLEAMAAARGIGGSGPWGAAPSRPWGTQRTA
ncbi:MAG TPA: zinc metalloprotease HtpX [Stellaceae bacterium]|jgi:heat shock protein HtpX|nr:zinc metalloprotease HtpX [Stellaceae bacterium]